MIGRNRRIQRNLARASITRHPGLTARDLLHLACCRRRSIKRIHTFDRALRAAVEAG
jgi:predicted nucleic acid-binding protein